MDYDIRLWTINYYMYLNKLVTKNVFIFFHRITVSVYDCVYEHTKCIVGYIFYINLLIHIFSQICQICYSLCCLLKSISFVFTSTANAHVQGVCYNSYLLLLNTCKSYGAYYMPSLIVNCILLIMILVTIYVDHFYISKLTTHVYIPHAVYNIKLNFQLLPILFCSTSIGHTSHTINVYNYRPNIHVDIYKTIILLFLRMLPQSACQCVWILTKYIISMHIFFIHVMSGIFCRYLDNRIIVIHGMGTIYITLEPLLCIKYLFYKTIKHDQYAHVIKFGILFILIAIINSLTIIFLFLFFKLLKLHNWYIIQIFDYDRPFNIFYLSKLYIYYINLSWQQYPDIQIVNWYSLYYGYVHALLHTLYQATLSCYGEVQLGLHVHVIVHICTCSVTERYIFIMTDRMTTVCQHWLLYGYEYDGHVTTARVCMFMYNDMVNDKECVNMHCGMWDANTYSAYGIIIVLIKCNILHKFNILYLYKTIDIPVYCYYVHNVLCNVVFIMIVSNLYKLQYYFRQTGDA